MEVVFDNLKHGLMITVFVFVMMLLVDYVNVLTRGRMSQIIKGSRIRQYVTASFLGATPGCLGSFLNVSFYIRGLITFGAVAGGMIATSGDEAFVMLAMFPGKALFLFFILFVIGVISAYLADRLISLLRIKTCQHCDVSFIHPEDTCRCLGWRDVAEHLKKLSLARFLLLVLLLGSLYGFIAGVAGPQEWGWERITFVILLFIASFIVITVPEHYLEEHIWKHIAKRHLWRVFLWSFGALLIVDLGLKFFNLEMFVKTHMFWVLLIAAVVAIIPESGPHLIFVMMFAKGIIPFSVLLCSSIVQDGHGMLPLLSYTVKDSFLIKLFNFMVGLAVSVVLYYLGF